MGGLDTIISVGIVVAFFTLIISKIYGHEKEHIDPIIQKIKGWFAKGESDDSMIGPDDDFELEFRGRLSDY